MSHYEPRIAESGRKPSCLRTDPLAGHEARVLVLENGALPQIYMTLHDWERVFTLVRQDGPCLHSNVCGLLIRTLDRAILCSSDAIPSNVVTINSCFRFRGHIEQELETRTLISAPIHSGDMTLSAQIVSMETTLGAALLGLPAPCHMPYVLPDGTARMLSLEEIIYQPEAHRRFHPPDSSGARSTSSNSKAVTG